MRDARAGERSDLEAASLIPEALYLAPGIADPFRWSEDGEALVFSGEEGGTIAFREEVRALLETLAPRGLPPFPALVLVLAALAPGGTGAFPRSLARPLALGIEGEEAPPGSLRAGLERLAALPSRLRRGGPARARLLEAIFERTRPRIPPSQAARVISLISGGLDRRVRLAGGRMIGGLLLALGAEEGEIVVHALRPRAGLRFEADRLGLTDLARALHALDEEALLLRAETSLDALPGEAGPAAREGRGGALASDPARVRALLAALALDPEHEGLARLARDALAATRTPRALAREDDLPVGGVADIANAGPLDRLLLSELAHDDLTLAVRIAEREALYTRREAPRRARARSRAVLCDAGIRLWGRARPLMAAVALALLAGAPDGARVLAFRAEDADAAPLDLSRREGLLSLLAALSPRPHPGASLPAFLAALAPEAHPAGAEAFLVTHPLALADPGLLSAIERALSRGPRIALYAASVDEEGRYRLDALTPRGRRRLVSARLDLARALAPPAPAPRPAPPEEARPLPPLHLETRDARLPAALREERLPLLLPAEPAGLSAVFEPMGGVLLATHDRRLLHVARPLKGARELEGRLPEGRLLAIEVHGARGTLVFAHRRRVTIVTADLQRARARRAPIDAAALAGGRPPLAAWVEPSGVVLVEPRAIGLYDPESGARIRRFELPRGLGTLGPFGRRYVRFASGARRVYVDGSAVTLAPYPLGDYRLEREEGAVALVDRPGAEEPLLLTSRGVRTPAGALLAAPLQRPRPKEPGATSDPRLPGRIVGLRAVSSLAMRLVVEISIGRDVYRTRALLELRPGESQGAVPIVPGGVPVRLISRLARAPSFLALEPGALPYAGSPAPILRRLERIGVAEAGRLAFVGGGASRAYLLERVEGRLELTPLAPRAPLRVPFVPFERLEEALPGAPRGLARARFAEGSEAFLDPRGLLHLRSAERSIPETSVNLALGPVAGWSQDGARTGPRFFHAEEEIGEARESDPRRALGWIERSGTLGRVAEHVTAFARRLS